MESPLNSPKPTPASLKRRRRLEFWVPIFGILLLIVILVLALIASSNRDLIWLTPADVKPANHNGPLAQLKLQVKKLILPVWQRFRRSPPLVELDANILAVGRDAASQIILGPPTSTNDNGLRAWILSPAELRDFHQRLKTNAGIQYLNSPRIMTGDGMQAQVQMVNLIVGRIKSSDTAAPVPIGTIVDVVPKIVSGSIRVTVGASSTSFVSWSPERLLLIKTNFTAACRVLIPNAGALVVDGGNSQTADGTNYWLIICPTILDARGRPVKP